jgi:transglutaminase-like putative cysteine protease
MSKRIKSDRLTTEELQQLQWLIGGLLTLLSLWALCALDLQAGWLLLLGATIVCGALVKPRWVVALPTAAWRLVGPVMLLVILADFAFNLPNFLPPLMRMVILLLVYRNLAPRRRREDLQLLLLCLLCVVVAGALTVSLVFALQILLFTPLAMALLFVICLLDQAPEVADSQSSWLQFSWPRLAQRVWHVVDLGVLALGGVLFALVVGISMTLFVLMPRFNLEQAIPFLQIQTQSRSGLSEHVELGAVSAIGEDHRVALRIDVPSLQALESTPYWRVLVLDQYRSGAFRLSDALQQRPFREYAKRRELPAWTGWDVPAEQRQAALWTFYFEGGVSRYLPLPGAFHALRFAAIQDVQWQSDLHLVSLDAVQQSVFSYQIEDLQWGPRAPASQAESDAYLGGSKVADLPADTGVVYPLTALELAMEAEDRTRLHDFNRDLIGAESDLSAAHYSQLVTDYLRGKFRYSLSPDATDGRGDPVVGWLSDGSRGHCELFAAAFVLLAREAGYPARMVVGFVGGSWNTLEAFFVVRNSDAHAWVEIYDADSQEWLRVDPTPGASPSNPDQRMPANFGFESGWTAWLDSLRMQWYRRIVNFDQMDQLEMATTMMDRGDGLLKVISAHLRGLGELIRGWLAQPLSHGNLIRGAVALGVLLSVWYCWRARDWLLSLLLRWFKHPQALDPVRRRATRYLRRVRDKEQLLQTGDAEQLSRYRKLRGELEAVRFGPQVSAQRAQVVFAEARRALRHRLKR